MALPGMAAGSLGGSRESSAAESLAQSGPSEPVASLHPSHSLTAETRQAEAENQSQARCKIVEAQMWVGEGEEGQEVKKGCGPECSVQGWLEFNPGKGTWPWKRSDQDLGPRSEHILVGVPFTL